MLIMAWRKHLPIHGEEQELRSAFVLPKRNTGEGRAWEPAGAI
jgi:hypothetical protein